MYRARWRTTVADWAGVGLRGEHAHERGEGIMAAGHLDRQSGEEEGIGYVVCAIDWEEETVQQQQGDGGMGREDACHVDTHRQIPPITKVLPLIIPRSLRSTRSVYTTFLIMACTDALH